MAKVLHFWPDLALVSIEDGKRSQVVAGAAQYPARCGTYAHTNTHTLLLIFNLSSLRLLEKENQIYFRLTAIHFPEL